MKHRYRSAQWAAVWLPLGGLIAICLAVVPVQAQEIDREVCADCHDLVEAFDKTPHGMYFSDDVRLSEAACQSCHGPATEHIEDGDPAKIINPAQQDQFSASSLCLNCHRDQGFDDWTFSEHHASDVSCASCHVVHQASYSSLKKQDPELCYDCHTDVRAAAYMPSRHPIAEGKIQCTDCHNIHGGLTPFAHDGTGRELCFTCHAEIEGPFVYEHAPVEEDCMICHAPHGAVADKLLKQNEPALCLNCHAMHFHATIEGLDGDFIPPADSSLLVQSTPDGWRRGMLTKCTQCHSSVHGSDLPSQATSSGGNALTR
jgi:DmsE family decaheme c-type cytochrome